MNDVEKKSICQNGKSNDDDDTGLVDADESQDILSWCGRSFMLMGSYSKIQYQKGFDIWPFSSYDNIITNNITYMSTTFPRIIATTLYLDR